MLQQMHKTNKLNVYGFLKHIRTQRNYLVQTEEQYVFTYDVLVEALKSGNTEIHRDQFATYVQDLMLPPPNKANDATERQTEKPEESKEYGDTNKKQAEETTILELPDNISFDDKTDCSPSNDQSSSLLFNQFEVISY